MKLIWVDFLSGGTQRGYKSDWGYAEGYNFDLGVHEYQKVEKPWNMAMCNNLLIDMNMISFQLHFFLQKQH
jgi:hypothetical protein